MQLDAQLRRCEPYSQRVSECNNATYQMRFGLSRHARKETRMSDSPRSHALASLLCLVVLFMGCNRTPDRGKTTPGDGTKQEPAPGSQTVSDKPQSKEAPGSSPTVEPKRRDIDQSFHISLE